MYKISIGLASLLITGIVHARDLSVNIENISQAQAPVICALFDREKGFPIKREFALLTSKADLNATCLFKDIPTGRIAVSVVEDLNNNGKVDTSFVGAPREPWGVSNNVPAHTFGPPTFAEAALNADSTSSINIILIKP